MRNRYIIIEGLDGAGKTSIVEWIVKDLKAYHVFEPGSEKVFRNIILNEENSDAQLLMYMADRIIIHENIKTYLEDADVVSDRGFPSSYVYQNPKKASILHNTFSDCLIVPDKIYILDIPYNVFLERRGVPLNRMDRVASEKFEEIRQRYLQLSFPNISILDGTKPIADSVDIILDDLAK